MLKSLVICSAIAVLLVVGLALLSAGSASAAFDDTDGDGVIDVAELIAGSDPHNAASGPESTAGALYLLQPVCIDGIDNDLDGQADETDPGCTDTDHDVVDDPSERVLGSDPDNFDSVPEDSRVDAVLVSLGFITFQCNDGLDNDLDGLVDEGDPGCAPFDTDGDGFGDVLEKTYGSDPNDSASQPEDDRVDPALCTDGVDNDRDGLIDVADEGCLAHPTPTPTSAPPTAEPTEQTTPQPVATATPAPTVAGLPATGSGPGDGFGLVGELALGLIAVGGCVVAGLAARRSARARGNA